MPFDNGSTEASGVQLVVFRLGDEEFGIPIPRVREILRMPKVTYLLETSSFVEGLFNLRGVMVPLVDLRRLLAVSACKENSDRQVIVVDSAGKLIGLIVDAVLEVLYSGAREVEITPVAFQGLKPALCNILIN